MPRFRVVDPYSSKHYARGNTVSQETNLHPERCPELLFGLDSDALYFVVQDKVQDLVWEPAAP